MAADIAASHGQLVAGGEPPAPRPRYFASLLKRALIAPYWVNHHGEHHIFTQVSCRNLAKALLLLTACGVTGRIEVQPDFVRVLQLTAAKSAAFGNGGRRKLHWFYF